MVVHAPLLATYMPANLNYFLLELLDVAKYDDVTFGDTIEISRKEEGVENYRLSLDEDSEFSYLLNDCGYKNLFSRNLVITIFLTCICFVTLIALIIFDVCRAPTRKPRKLKQAKL